MAGVSINKSLGTKWFTFYTKVRPVFIYISTIAWTIVSFVLILADINPFLNAVNIFLQIIQFVLAKLVVYKSKEDYGLFVAFVRKNLFIEWLIGVAVAVFDVYIEYIEYNMIEKLSWTSVSVVVLVSSLWYHLNVKYFEKRLPKETAVDINTTINTTGAPEPSKKLDESIKAPIPCDRAEAIATYFKNIKGTDVDVETMANQEKIITINYQRLYHWTLCIAVDETKKIVKLYAWFFEVSSKKEKDIYELLNEWNKETIYAKYTVEITSSGSFVIAQLDIPVMTVNSFEKIVFDISDKFVQTIDERFGVISKDLTNA